MVTHIRQEDGRMRMRSWRGVGLVTGWQFTASLAFYAIFASTAFVRSDFGLSRALTGTVVTAIMLGYTVLLFGTGAAVDGYGERPVMILGLLGMAVGCVGGDSRSIFRVYLFTLTAPLGAVVRFTHRGKMGVSFL